MFDHLLPSVSLKKENFNTQFKRLFNCGVFHADFAVCDTLHKVDLKAFELK